MENKDDLYIPLGIKSKRDRITGFGTKELFMMAVIASITLILASLYYSMTHNSFGTVFGCLVIGASTLIVLKKNETNQSVLDLATHVIDYARGQKIFKYIYLKEWV